jgi:hypothetical protein
MNVIGHYHLSHDDKTVPPADLFQHFQEQIAALWTRQPRLPMITTTIDEMKLLRPVVSLGMPRHPRNLA